MSAEPWPATNHQLPVLLTTPARPRRPQPRFVLPPKMFFFKQNPSTEHNADGRTTRVMFSGITTVRKSYRWRRNAGQTMVLLADSHKARVGALYAAADCNRDRYLIPLWLCLTSRDHFFPCRGRDPWRVLRYAASLDSLSHIRVTRRTHSLT